MHARQWLAAAAATLAVLAASAAIAASLRGGPTGSVPARPVSAASSTTVEVSTTTPPPTTVPVTTAPPPVTAAPALGPVALAGCPPPIRPPGPPPAPWHPAVLVPDTALPAVTTPTAWTADRTPAVGKGMWIWQVGATQGGNSQAIVARAVRAGLRQLWVRVGDSRDGFYAGSFLDSLVGLAHASGLQVIGWGFPYLYDPVGDAHWTAAALAWRGSDGATLDGFSPDIETASEGVALTERRAEVYLQEVRRAAGNRLLVATVFQPTDRMWRPGVYPYQAIATYVDAFAPMVYWGCTEPGAAATLAIRRLSPMRPVHLIGQAYDMGPEGGRVGSPSGLETMRFLDVARRGGALGASFWVWQEASPAEWDAIAGFDWPWSAQPTRPPPPG